VNLQIMSRRRLNSKTSLILLY